MRPDNQNNGRGGGNGKRNLTAIVSVVLWALVITVLINYITSIAQRANTEEILYGEFRQMVMEDKALIIMSTVYAVMMLFILYKG